MISYIVTDFMIGKIDAKMAPIKLMQSVKAISLHFNA